MTIEVFWIDKDLNSKGGTIFLSKQSKLRTVTNRNLQIRKEDMF